MIYCTVSFGTTPLTVMLESVVLYGFSVGLVMRKSLSLTGKFVGVSFSVHDCLFFAYMVTTHRSSMVDSFEYAL